MLELKLLGENGYANEMMLFTEIIHWLMASIIESAEEVYLQGYVAIFDNNTSKLNILLLCGGQYQDKIKTILNSPPEMFKNKFTVEDVQDETDPNAVEDTDDDDEDKMVVSEDEKEGGGGNAAEGYDITVKANDKEMEVQVTEKS